MTFFIHFRENGNSKAILTRKTPKFKEVHKCTQLTLFSTQQKPAILYVHKQFFNVLDEVPTITIPALPLLLLLLF